MRASYILLSVFLLLNCNSPEKKETKTTVIDFQENKSTQLRDNVNETQTLKVAVSAIITPRETINYYQDLLNFIATKLNYEIEFKQRKTYEEVNELLIKMKLI